MACAARLWAPLRDERDVPEELRGRTLERLRLFADAYGLARGERLRVADAVLDAHERCYRVVGAAVDRGHERFGRMWREGGSARARPDPEVDRRARPADAIGPGLVAIRLERTRELHA